MNPGNGHLVNNDLFQELLKGGKAEDFEQVPKRLQVEAEKRLAGAREVFIPKQDSRSPLGKWAAEQRKARLRQEKHMRYLERKRRLKVANRRLAKASLR